MLLCSDDILSVLNSFRTWQFLRQDCTEMHVHSKVWVLFNIVKRASFFPVCWIVMFNARPALTQIETRRAALYTTEKVDGVEDRNIFLNYPRTKEPERYVATTLRHNAHGYLRKFVLAFQRIAIFQCITAPKLFASRDKRVREMSRNRTIVNVAHSRCLVFDGRRALESCDLRQCTEILPIVGVQHLREKCQRSALALTWKKK